MRRKLFLCFLFFLLFIPLAFPWQIEPFQKELPSGDQKNQITLNIVFLPLNYQRKDNFKKDTSLIISRLKITSPFNQFRGFRFYLLNITSKEKGILFKKCKKFPYLEVRNDLIRDIRNKLNGTYKLAILDKGGNTSAAEISKANEISLIILGRNSYGKKNRLSKAFLHEFGHSLGLREENPSSSQPIIAGPPNCAPDKETAVKWWGNIAKTREGVDYFKMQSGEKVFIKPTRRSIMNNPFISCGYGPVNERYLRRELGITK